MKKETKIVLGIAALATVVVGFYVVSKKRAALSPSQPAPQLPAPQNVVYVPSNGNPPYVPPSDPGPGVLPDEPIYVDPAADDVQPAQQASNDSGGGEPAWWDPLGLTGDDDDSGMAGYGFVQG